MSALTFQIRHDYGMSSSGIEVPVTISVDPNHSVALLAKIDTGAEFCVFQRDYAELLELRVEDGERKQFSTATGVLETHGHFVTLSCLGYQFESMVFFHVHEGFPRNVLGLQGWLNRFRFGLIHHDRLFFLSHYDE